MGKIRMILYGFIIFLIYYLIYQFYPRYIFASPLDYVNQLDLFLLGRNIFFLPFFILSLFLFIMFPVAWGIYFLSSFGKIKLPKGSEDFYPSISIIIPALNEEAVIGDSLESLLETNYPKDKLELIIVASNSTDRTVEICEKYQDKIPMKILTKSLPIKGKPAALNHAITEASHDILAFYDADLEMEPDTLHFLVRPLFNENVHAAVGNIRPSNWNVNWMTKTIALEYTNHSGAGIFTEIRNKIGLSALILGRNWCIRKDSLKKVGGFDENCLTEDLNLSYRLMAESMKIAFSPKAVISEKVPTTFKSFKQQRERWIGGYVQNVTEEMEVPKKEVIPNMIMITQFQPMVDFSIFLLIASLIFLFIFNQVFLFMWFLIPSLCMTGVILNGIRKYGQKRFGLILYYPTAIFLNTFMLSLQFKRKKTTEWEKTILE
ncbi:MAG: glycosyltransferase [Candidatus Helarchaeota archaeon]